MHTLFVVSHTHWDREWYEPFQVYRAWLVRCIDKLLDIFETDPAFAYFLLDGQTIVLEDYLEVRPARAQTLRNLIGAGKLHVGPWYILPDEFLVSGEALIRNLQRGTRIAREFGGGMSIGYIPDPFGHISQMPQLLRGFGFSAAVFRRGLADEPAELWWDAPDGTRVLACYLRDSYDNAAWLQHTDEAFAVGIAKLRASLAPHVATPNILLMNGTDHMEPWRDLPRLLTAAREKISDARIVHASLPMYVTQVEHDLAQEKIDLPIVRGELRNPKKHHLLPGVASARLWIKQRNARAQTLLEQWAEPFSAFAAQFTAADKAENANQVLLQLAWKYLLQNHPHDSICGCGVDITHDEMRTRFDWVEQIAEPIVRSSLHALAAQINTQAYDNAAALVVFNPTNAARTDTVHATLELPGSLEHFALSDQTHPAIPFHIVDQHATEYYRTQASAEMLSTLLAMGQAGRVLGMAIQDAFIRADTDPIQLDVTLTTQGEPNRDLLVHGLPPILDLIAQKPDAVFDVRAHSPTQFEIEFVAPEIPGLGYRTFQINNAPLNTNAPSATPQFLENEFYRVEPDHNGTLTITDKTTGAVYRNANRFVDGGDRGDLYNYCPPENDTLVAAPHKSPRIEIERNVARQTLSITLAYRLPAQLSDERSARALDTVEETIATRVTVYPGVRRIDFETRVENRARDHRLRVEFPAPFDTTIAHAAQAFDVVQRALDLPTDTAAWIEQPRPEAPMQQFVSISDGMLGLTLAARGLPEYQARREPNGTTLALTVLRCVGWLSRDDLANRVGHAGPAKETPGAQAIGAHVFEYALIPHAGDWRNAIHEARAFAAPLRAIATDAHRGTLAPTQSLLATSPCEFLVSAIKLAEDGSGLIVRGYNVDAADIEAEIVVAKQYARAMRVNLNEQVIAPIALDDGHTVKLSVRAKEIVTLEFA